MGNSSSSSPREVQTTSGNRHNVGRPGIVEIEAPSVAPSTPNEEQDCRLNAYTEYLDHIFQEVSNKEYNFDAPALYQLDPDGGIRVPDDALSIRGRLSASGINKVWNELYRQMFALGNIRIQFRLRLPVDNDSILRQFGTDLASEIICEDSESALVKSWEFTNVEVDLTLDHLEHDFGGISRYFEKLTALYRAGTTGTRNKIGPSLSDEEDKCCICLEPLVPSDGTGQYQQLFHMQCGHCIHLTCYEQLMQQDPESRCPICRSALTNNEAHEEIQDTNDERIAQLEMRLELLRSANSTATSTTRDNQVQNETRNSTNDRLAQLEARLDLLYSLNDDLASRLARLRDESGSDDTRDGDNIRHVATDNNVRQSLVELRLSRLRD